MNANSQPKTPTYDSWLNEATNLLQADGIDSARLDAELILAHSLRRPRTYLHAHGDELLEQRIEDIADARLELRREHTPVAYIIGHKEFYGRRFKTTPAALIPRPESETIIELLADVVPKNVSLLPDKLHLIDVGTGTGCLGITAKLEWPELDVVLTDISNHALTLARQNAEILNADVQFVKGDLLRGYGAPADIIIANLPYVDRSWDVSPDTHAEPDQALYANDGGLSLIYELLDQAALLLRPGGHLLLESDNRQQSEIITAARQRGLKHQKTDGLITQFSKI
ncbi:MAG: putative Modification methylase, HemK family [Candidatus Saccharibacteria bacterium]|nr:putative Modification methylase, HemK family [Candidatus Saccharibacteria bacterium]